MPWKEMTVEKLAAELNVNISEVREKQRLIQLIVKTRTGKRLSQAALAKKIGVSQSRIAQIESGIGTAQISFDLIFRILEILGIEWRVVTRKAD